MIAQYSATFSFDVLDMHEGVFFARLTDEAESRARIEPLNNAGPHDAPP